MGGAFGGLLQVLASLGLMVQVTTRHGLWLLIGPQAYDWNLDALAAGHPRFKEQRLSREALGGATVTVAVLLALPAVAGFAAATLVILAEWALFALASAVRFALDQKNERASRQK
jgi:hypothetical protein